MKRKAIYIIMVSLLAAAAVSCTREIQAPDGEEATLKRPFAKIRVIDDRTKSDQGQYTTKLTFDNHVSIPVEYNALTGVVTYATITETPTCTSTFEEGTGLCLFTSYIFVPDQQSTKYSFTIVVSDENKTSVANIPVSDVTVRRNALTTVKGKIL